MGDNLFKVLITSAKAKVTPLVTKIKLWTSWNFIRTRLITRIRDFFTSLFNVRPRHKKDYYEMFGWLVSRRLAIALMVAVGVLRASGFLDFVGGLFSGIAARLGFSSELVPLMLIKMFSSSAATGLVLDIFKNHGPDSLIGLTTSIMMSCTETIFYTMSVYFLAAKVTKTRYTLKGALLSTLAGIVASIVLAGMLV